MSVRLVVPETRDPSFQFSPIGGLLDLAGKSSLNLASFFVILPIKQVVRSTVGERRETLTPRSTPIVGNADFRKASNFPFPRCVDVPAPSFAPVCYQTAAYRRAVDILETVPSRFWEA
jgi:hypothetical protein